jgi:hypothetical protein
MKSALPTLQVYLSTQDPWPHLRICHQQQVHKVRLLVLYLNTQKPIRLGRGFRFYKAMSAVGSTNIADNTTVKFKCHPLICNYQFQFSSLASLVKTSLCSRTATDSVLWNPTSVSLSSNSPPQTSGTRDSAMDAHLKAVHIYLDECWSWSLSRGNPTKIWYALILSHGQVLLPSFIYLPVTVRITTFPQFPAWFVSLGFKLCLPCLRAKWNRGQITLSYILIMLKFCNQKMGKLSVSSNFGLDRR